MIWDLFLFVDGNFFVGERNCVCVLSIDVGYGIFLVVNWIVCKYVCLCFREFELISINRLLVILSVYVILI